MSTLLGSLKSKTAWFALALVVLGALQQNMGVVTEVVGEGNVGWFTSFVGAAVYVLRLLTKAPLDEK